MLYAVVNEAGCLHDTFAEAVWYNTSQAVLQCTPAAAAAAACSALAGWQGVDRSSHR